MNRTSFDEKSLKTGYGNPSNLNLKFYLFLFKTASFLIYNDNQKTQIYQKNP